MPVSPIPLLLPLICVIAVAISLRWGGAAFLKTLATVFILVGVMALPVYIPGWWLMYRAHQNDAPSLYRLAKWHENHCEQINAYMLWPCSPDVLKGYACLERAAKQDYPPAVYAVGVRLKYGDHVPQPERWRGPAGNHFPQPERGQPLIDKALRLGYKPIASEELFYWHVYRELWVADPHG